MLRAHDLIESDNADETNLINIKYIAEVLANDWGFWKDATENLEKVKKAQTFSRLKLSQNIFSKRKSTDTK